VKTAAKNMMELMVLEDFAQQNAQEVNKIKMGKQKALTVFLL